MAVSPTNCLASRLFYVASCSRFSAEQLVDRQKTTAKKRRRNQNVEIDELAKLLPVKALALAAPSNGSQESPLMGESSRAKTQSVDKISVLRITSTFLKFQEFMKNGYFSKFIR